MGSDMLNQNKDQYVLDMEREEFQTRFEGLMEADQAQKDRLNELEQEMAKLGEELLALQREGRMLHQIDSDLEGQLSAKSMALEDTAGEANNVGQYVDELELYVKETKEKGQKMKQDAIVYGTSMLIDHSSDADNTSASFRQFWNPEAIKNVAQLQESQMFNATGNEDRLEGSLNQTNQDIQRIKEQRAAAQVTKQSRNEAETKAKSTEDKLNKENDEFQMLKKKTDDLEQQAKEDGMAIVEPEWLSRFRLD